MEGVIVGYLAKLGPGVLVPASFLYLFAKLDGWVSPAFRHWLSGHLRTLETPRPSRRWAMTFLILFRKVFGRKALSWRFFGLSCSASSVGVVVMTIIWELLYPGTLGSIFEIAASIERRGELRILILWAMLPVILNFLPDYISLIETRIILSLLKNIRGWKVIVLIISDILLTLLIFLIVGVGIFNVLVIYIIGINNFLQVDHDVTFAYYLYFMLHQFYDTAVNAVSESVFEPRGKPIPAGIFLYTTFFTSVWIWLYVASLGLFRLFALAGPVLKAVQFVLPIGERPLFSIGVVAFLPPLAINVVLVWIASS